MRNGEIVTGREEEAGIKRMLKETERMCFS